MADSNKVLFRCPVCERTFRVPVSYAQKSTCPDCAKVAAEQRIEATAPENVRVDPIKSMRTERPSWWGRVRRGISAVESHKEAVAEAERQRKSEKHVATVSRGAGKLRSYGFLVAWASFEIVCSTVAAVIGACVTLYGLENDGTVAVQGLVLVALSLSGIAGGHLIRLAVHVARDIEETKQWQFASLQNLKSLNRQQRGPGSDSEPD